uniref:Putative cation-transporting atpase fly n=1 Tax=Ixodes ricinus TaxID=34613 RepID=A0A0K8R7Q5_IXORI
MLPEQKLQLIEALQEIGHQVGMCGDGANDCGALKAAHAGVSLSVAEASVASPFTAQKQNIKCMLDVIREGRATLAATFGAFRYMVCYCFVLLAGALFLFWDGQKPSEGAYVFIDIVVSLVPPMIFGTTEPFFTLVKKVPARSLSNFLSIFSILSFIVIQTKLPTFSHTSSAFSNHGMSLLFSTGAKCTSLPQLTWLLQCSASTACLTLLRLLFFHLVHPSGRA